MLSRSNRRGLRFPLGWIEIPKCDDHRLGLFLAPTVRDRSGCSLTVNWLDTVSLGGEPIIHLSFEFRKVLGSVRGEQPKLCRHNILLRSSSSSGCRSYCGPA